MGFYFHVGEAFRQGPEDLLTLHPRDRGSEAVVDAGAESDMGIGPAGDVHRVRVVELLGVAVGRWDDPPDPVILLDGLAADEEIYQAACN